ncbi:MAG TPA: hypothetical protein VGM47_05675 [Gammaproteobacteria bacterium]|jgi:hypothetical protein
MSEIGDDVAVLRHPGAASAGRKKGVVALLVLAPIVAVIVLMAGDFSFTAAGKGHQSLVVGLIMGGAYLLSALIALPGLLMIKREQMSEELHVGSRGMKLVQTLPGADGPRLATSWQVLWGEVTTAKLRYRDVDAPYDGTSIHTRNGERRDLYARDWRLEAGESRLGAVLPSLPGRRVEQLRSSDLVKTLGGKGLPLEDDVPRPQDVFAARLGLGLAAAAIIAALVFNYFVEH